MWIVNSINELSSWVEGFELVSGAEHKTLMASKWCSCVSFCIVFDKQFCDSFMFAKWIWNLVPWRTHCIHLMSEFGMWVCVYFLSISTCKRLHKIMSSVNSTSIETDDSFNAFCYILTSSWSCRSTCLNFIRKQWIVQRIIFVLSL